MTNLELISELKKRTFTEEEGEEYQLEFQAGVSAQEMETIRQSFPNRTLAPELAEILAVTRGWDGYGLEMVLFGSIGQFGFEELSPFSVTLGHDGFGNFWILDIDKNGQLGKVWFACHDPAVFVIHSQNLNEYLHHLLEFYENPGANHVDEIHDRTVMEIWDENRFCSSRSEFESKNPEFKEFLNRFEGEEWTVADLRAGRNKDGFAWGRFGANGFTIRHPEELVWVMKNRKKGFFARLFGK